MWSKVFWKQAIERAIRAFAGTALSSVGSGALNIISVPWEAVLSLAAGAALVSILISLSVSASTGTASASTVDVPPKS
jgi:hypothetical protein